MVKLTMLILTLLLGACQTTQEVQLETEKSDVSCGPSLAQYTYGLHDILTSKNEDITWRNLGDRDHKTFMASYNSTPPPTDFKPDNIRFYYKRGAVTILKVMSLDTCIIQAGALPLSLIETWLQGIPTNVKVQT